MDVMIMKGSEINPELHVFIGDCVRPGNRLLLPTDLEEKIKKLVQELVNTYS
jgi:hypothetical protein